MRRPVIGAALAELGAHQLRNLSLHQLAHKQPKRLAQHISVLIDEHAPNDLLSRHPLLTGHLWCLQFVEP